MIPLGLGVLVLTGLWWLGRNASTANPATLAKLLRRLGGLLALAAAALLFLRGRFDAAILLGLFGGSLLGWRQMPALPFGLGGAAAPRAAGTASRVRSATVEMELDHDTGALRGRVLTGPLAGRDLDTLGLPDLRSLLAAARAGDPEGEKLLEAYLDRRFAGWREDAERDADPRPGGAAQPGPMAEDEAYQILGLQPGASAEEVRRAHRTLMKRLHPDQGGSDYLAARVNAAKDRLLNRHR
ncbi:heat shock protein DnaJ domain protein [Methylobacterium sp. 4-46]|uniref:DnaJ domain-containing protein n=1 Tax=unclassified Methylobacterium TaxID=2615210 RepID=UPI000152CDF9|nr:MULTISPECIES: DnaJ domain-containing protein [Methylobacterium]ACA16716.1 heat shock protein DnaJ domain protein [Methylobacterium sp. 4-46]WFT82415.1 DnaJ domain-containing protein [Methylobacterium nodulans]